MRDPRPGLPPFGLSLPKPYCPQLVVRPQAGGCPAATHFLFASPKRKEAKKKATLLSASPSLRCGATCGTRQKRGLARTRFAQTVASPDPLLPALLGADRRVGEEGKHPKTHTNCPPECRKRAALPARESQRMVMCARECSTRGHMKFPSIAQRGEGGVRGGSGEFKLRSQRQTGTQRDASSRESLDPGSSGITGRVVACYKFRSCLRPSILGWRPICLLNHPRLA